MFSYWTVYRTEGMGGTAELMHLTGAAPYPDAAPGEDTWIFWYGENDHSSAVRLFTFSEREEGPGGVITGTLAHNGAQVRFVPVTLDHIQANPAKYFLAKEDTENASPGDVNLVYHAAAVSDGYEGWVAPQDALVTTEDLQRLGRTSEQLMVEMMADRLDELRGKPAKVGDIHWWFDEGPHKPPHPYQKKDDGSGQFYWERVPTHWKDMHPDLPRDSREVWYRPDPNNPNSMPVLDPARGMLHEALISKFFEGKKPTPPDQKPVAIYVMGMPAAGKSTLVQHPEKVSRHLSRIRDGLVHLDPDDIVEALPEFKKAVDLKARNGAQIVRAEATKVNDAAFERAWQGHYSFVLSGTGADMEWMKNDFLALADKGYEVIIYMPQVNDMDDLMIRTAARGEVKGRFVPPSVLWELQKRLPKNFMELKNDPRVSEMALINTEDDLKPDADRDRRPNAKPAWTMKRRSDGSVEELPLDPVFFEEFKKHLTESLEAELLAKLDADQASRVLGFSEAIRLDLVKIANSPKVFKLGEGMYDLLPFMHTKKKPKK